MEKKLIRGATVVTMDAGLGILPKADILIAGKHIREIAPSIRADDAEVIDAGGMIAAPGFIDGHRHNWQGLLKMIGVNFTMSDYVSGIKWVFGDAFTEEELYLSEYLGALECLNAGTTTMCNFAHNNISPAHTDMQVKAMLDAGIRCVFCYSGSNFMWKEMPSTTPYDYADARRVKQRYASSGDQLFSMAIGARGPQNVSMELALEEINLAKELGVMCMLSIGEGLWAAACPNTVELLEQQGVLDDTMQFTHMNAIAQREFDLLAHRGAQMVMCPEVELSMGFGWNATRKCKQAGILPGVSSDTPPSVSCDLFSQMKTALVAARNQTHLESLANRVLLSPMSIDAIDVLRYATNAATVGLGRKVGSLAPGKEADLILIDTNTVQMMPMNGPVNAIVEYAGPRDVDTVMVAGDIVKQNGRLVGVDPAALRKQADAARDKLFARCKVPPDGFWKPEPFVPDFEV